MSGHPSIDNIPVVSPSDLFLEDPLDATGFVMNLVERYGDIFQYRTSQGLTYLVTRPDLVHRIFQQHHFRRYTPLRMALGNGLLSSTGPYWASQRRLMQPRFKKHRVVEFAPLVTDLTKTMLEVWNTLAARADPLDVASEMRRLTLMIIAKALFNGAVANDVIRIGEGLTAIVEDLGELDSIAFNYPLMISPSRNRQFRHAIQGIDDIAYRLIRNRRETAEKPDDPLTLLLSARDPATNQPLDDRQIRDEIVTMLLAGHETTANALTWTWHLLAEHRHVEQRFHDELRRTLCAQVPSAQNIPELEYTKMIFQESMRLYPPVWIQSRMTLQDVEIGDYSFPAGTVVLLCPYAVHRHPASWRNPELFDPDRFHPDRRTTRPRHAYFPFGIGHYCIGEPLALLEGTLVLAMVGQNFRIRPLPTHPVEIQTAVTLRQRNGLPAMLEPQ